MSGEKRYAAVFAIVVMCMACGARSLAQKLPFINYSTADGLMNNRTDVARQDRKGYLWIGMDVGIDRFDGRIFKHYPCPDNPYRSARYATAYNGSVIFSVDYYGIAVCRGDSAHFIPLKAKTVSGINGAVGVNDSTFYVVNSPRSLYKISGSATRKIDIPDSLKADREFEDLFKDRQGNIYILTSKGLIYFPVSDMARPARVPFFEKSYCYCIVQDKNGDVYVSAANGVYKYTERQWGAILTERPELIFPPRTIITSVTFDEENVWMGSCYTGVYKYDRKTRAINNYTVANGLVCQNVWGMFRDKEDNIWVTTENGISKLTSQSYSSVDVTREAYQNVKCAIEWNDSTLLFSDILDLYSYTPSGIRKISGYKNEVGYDEDILRRTPDNRLLITVNKTVDGGLLSNKTIVGELWNNKLVNTRDLNTLPGNVNIALLHMGAIVGDKDLWLRTDKGLRLYQDGRLSEGPRFKDDKPVTYMRQGAHGELLTISDFKEVSVYDKPTIGAVGAPYAPTLRQTIVTRPINNSRYKKLFTDSAGHIFLLSNGGGVCMLNTDKDGRITRERYLPVTTFSNGIVNDMVEDNHHAIWVGTALGLDKLTFDKDTFSVEKDMYGTELCGKYIFFVKYFNHKLFVGTTGCMGVIDIDGKTTAIAPDVYVAGVKVNDKEIAADQAGMTQLGPDDNIITFTFTGLSYKDERKIKYSYKLEGLDDDWSEPGSEYTITYSRVPPGTYTFLVKARSATGVWSPVPAAFTFTIARPFYTRWWFIALVVLVALAIIYAIYRYRINQLMKIYRIRETISKDLHDDIGATVSSISILADMAKSDLVSDSKRNQFLETIQEESRHVSGSLNDIVWSINPKYDSQDVMFARMRRYASELFEARDMAYEFHLPEGDTSALSMDMTLRQHVYLIFKEAVNNMVKYSGATKADITLQASKDKFIMTIKDNGKGFDATTAHPGNGIFNMKKRAQEINATLNIESGVGNGTSITLVSPS